MVFLVFCKENQNVPKDVVRVKIDSSVKKIKKITREAFKDCKSLKDVEFSEGLQEIGSLSFANCVSLVSLSLPRTTQTICSFAFYSCKSLKNVEMKEGLIEIKEGAFSSCKSLEEVSLPSTVRCLKRLVFANCERLCLVELNDSLEEIADDAFSNCTMLAGNIKVPNSVTYIGREAMPVETSPKLVAEIPSVSVEKNADDRGTEIDTQEEPDGAMVLDSLKEKSTVQKRLKETLMLLDDPEATATPDECIKEHHSVQTHNPKQPSTTAKNTAFHYRGDKQAVRKDTVRVQIDPSVKTILVRAFEQFKSLKEVEFSKGLIQIGERSFCGCASLVSISLPSTIRRIDRCAFYSCESLKVVMLREGLLEIQAQAFSWCRSLEKLSFPSTVCYLGMLAFANCQQLSSVALNEGLLEIGKFAFQNCNRLVGNIRVPSSVKRLGHEALPLASPQCTEIPDAVTSDSLNDRQSTLKNTTEETKRLRNELKRASDLTKKLEALMSERDDEIASLRSELRRTESNHIEEIRCLRADLNQTDNRTRILKEALSERDEEMKSLRDIVTSRDEDTRELRTKFATLQAGLESLKQKLGVASVPTSAVNPNGEQRATKRPRLFHILMGSDSQQGKSSSVSNLN